MSLMTWWYVLPLVALASGDENSCNNLAAAFDSFIGQAREGAGGGVFSLSAYDTDKGQLKDSYSHTNGLLAKTSTTPMAKDTLFEIASVTKTFVATLILKKVVEGAITLDSTAQTVLGADLPDNILMVNGQSVELKTRDLLQHTSGLQHFWDGAPKKTVATWYSELGLTPPTAHPYWAAFENSPVNYFEFLSISRPFLEPGSVQHKIWKPAEVLNVFAGNFDAGAPGEYSYSDTGYVILGLMIEKLYGKSLHEAIADMMQDLTGEAHPNTFIRYNDGVDSAQGNDRLSHRYFHNAAVGGVYDTTLTDADTWPANGIVNHLHNSADWAAGGLITTIADLRDFYVALMTAKTSPWKDVADMLVESASTAINSENYGYGIYTKSLPGATFYGHNGDGGGTMWYAPSKGVAFVGTNNNNWETLTNWASNDGATAFEGCMNWLMAQEPPTPMPTPAPPTPTPPTPAPDSDASDASRAAAFACVSVAAALAALAV